jgi:hypothetical protein
MRRGAPPLSFARDLTAGWSHLTPGESAMAGTAAFQRTRARRNFPIWSVASAASGVPSMIW